MHNKKYSILLVAFVCHYSHVARFVKYLKRTNPSVEITLFADRYDISDDIKENVQHIIYRHYYTAKPFIRSKCLSFLLNMIVLRKQFYRLSKSCCYDIVNIHFCQFFMAFLLRYIKKMGKKIVITPWGSDVLRLDSKIKRKLLGYVYRKANMVTVGLQGPLGSVVRQEFGVEDNKFCVLGWGSETIDYINEHLGDVSNYEAKAELGLGNGCVITCGYNAFPEQRHEAIIDAIKKVKEYLPSNTVLLFPVTYGSGDLKKKNDYVGFLKKKVNALGLKAVFYEDYLSVRDVFMLRRASDVFVHIQTTDAGNSTIMEYCICGNKVVHGSWMHYKWLDYQPRFYFPIDNMKDLPSGIVEACRADLPILPNEVSSIIKARGWSEKMIQWNDAFTSLLLL